MPSRSGFLCLVLSLLIPFAAGGSIHEVKAEDGENSAGLKLYQIASPACFHTVLQEKYIQDGNHSIQLFAKANAEISRPDALKFEWDAKNIKTTAKPTYYFTISENEDLSNGRIYQTNDNYVNVYNLKLATRYYYRVTTKYGGMESVSETLHFSTERSIFRNLYIDGVINARDLGGWRNSEGKFMVKQGMLFRSGPFNVSSASKYQRSITDDGLKETSYLGIKTEIDLRRVDDGETGGITTSPLGNSVKYLSAPLNWNIPDNALTLSENIASIKTIFETLGNKDNYPIDFHCTAGADRTGMIAFLINGLLGVSEADLYRDYQFTNFANVNQIRYRATISNSWVKTIKKQTGLTLQDKIVALLRSFGISLENLSNLYWIMQEEGYRP